MYLSGKVKRFIDQTYFNRQPLNDYDYDKGRKLFLAEGCSSNAVLTLTSGAFLSGYLNFLGADDSVNGIITGVPTLLCAVQIFSSVVLENISQRKFMIAMLAFLHRILLSAMFFVPFFVDGTGKRLFLLVTLFVVSHFCGSFVGAGACNWLVQMVPGNRLGYYLGTRDAWSLGVTTVLSLAMGKVLDWFRMEGKDGVGFLSIGALVFSIAFVNLYCFSNIKEPEYKRTGRTLKLADALKEPFYNIKFKKVMLFYILWNIALQVAAPFFSVYMVTGLKLDYTYIMILTLIGSAGRAAASTLWGKLADKRSWLYVTKMSMLMLGIVHFLWLFMTGETYLILQPVLQAASGIAWGGIAISTFNVQYMFAPEEGRVMYVSANASYAGIIGFLSTLVGAALLPILKPVNLGAFTFSSMQILFAVSGILIGFCVIYVKMVLEKKSVADDPGSC